MASSECPNCRTTMAGPYCHQCGQKQLHAGDLSMAHAGHHVFHEIFHLDGRLWEALRLLFLRPGQLSLDFLEGRRQRHLHPVRVFLVATAVFFVLGNATVLRLEHIATRSPRAAQLIERTARHRGVSQEEFVRSRNPILQTTYKLVIVASVFLTGLAQAVLFRRHHRQIGEHLTVAAHNQAALFLMGVPLGALSTLSPNPSMPLYVTGVAQALYTFLAFRRVYQEPALMSSLKTLCLVAVSYVWSMAAMGSAFRRAVFA